jgi:thioredoxin 1
MVEMIKFGAEWCGPCRMIKPTVNKLMEKYNTDDSEVKITDVDVDKDAEAAKKYGVRSIPTMVFLKDGQEVIRKVGVLDEKQIEIAIQEASIASLN